MNQFGRIVLGYHGCPANRPEALSFVRGLVAGTNRVDEWLPSSNEYDSLLRWESMICSTKAHWKIGYGPFSSGIKSPLNVRNL